jgi:hypothetical protein
MAILVAVTLLAGASQLSAVWAAESFSLTIYEQTGSIDAYAFQSTDPEIYAKLAGNPGPPAWGGSGYDFGTTGGEYYDIFFSDSLGNALALGPGDALPAPSYLTIVCVDYDANSGQIIPAPTWEGAGNNIDAVKITYGGVDYWANAVLGATYGLCDEPFSAKTSNFAYEALGPQNGAITKMGCGLSIVTLRFSPPPPFSLTIYEQTGSIDAYTFQSTDPEIYAKLAGNPGPPAWGGSGYDFGTTGGEYYDIFFSDPMGNPLALSPGDALPVPSYLTIVCVDYDANSGQIIPAPTWEGAGNNIDAVKISNGGVDWWAWAVIGATYGLCDEPFSAKTSNFAYEALGPQDGVITKMGCGLSKMTLEFHYPIATLLEDFSLTLAGSRIDLAWQLSSCDENMEFAVLRAKDPDVMFEKRPTTGLARDGLGFIYRDSGCEPGAAYRYRVECANGSSTKVLFETERIVTPATPLALHQNSPNPFNPSTTIRYYLPERMQVRLDVYDVSGRFVARLVDGEQSLGEKAVQWEGRNMRGERVSSGVYYYRLQAGKEIISRTMVLLR